MRKFIRLLQPGSSPLSIPVATALNLLLAFVVLTLCRIVFMLENHSYFSHLWEVGGLTDILLGGVRFDVSALAYINAVYILLVCFPLRIKENALYHKICKIIFVVINSVSVVINLADAVYFPFTLRRTTRDVFEEFSHEGNLLKIFGEAALTHWYLVIAAILLILLLWRGYFTPKVTDKSGKGWKYYVVTVVSLLVGAEVCVSCIRGGLLNHWYCYIVSAVLLYIGWRLRTPKERRFTLWGNILIAAGIVVAAVAPIGGFQHRDIRPIALSNAMSYCTRPIDAAAVLNTPFSLIRCSAVNIYTNPGYFPTLEEAEKIISPVHFPPAQPEVKEKKNLVVIIIESFGREYIGGFSKEVLGEDYKGFTPFTDSLINHSLTFRYSFCNGLKSIDGMPSVLASIPCMVKPFVLTPQALNTIKGLGALAGDEGYSTAFFHGARTGSMGFDAFAKSIGFEKYYGREDFIKDPRYGGDKEFDGYWAIWDEPFMQYYAGMMNEMKQPFATAIFTASSHHPFRIPEKYKDIYPEENLPIQKCIRYTDNALRNFFNTARKMPWFKNTIFVITSDHTNMSEHPEYMSDMGKFCSPIIIYDPSGEIAPGQRDAIAQQIDILPTLMSAIGYDKPYVAFGIDLLSTPDEETWAFNYLNGVYQFYRYGYMLQWDGTKTIGVYRLTDYKLENNLKGKVPEQSLMEEQLKGLIQSYMTRMTENRLY